MGKTRNDGTRRARRPVPGEQRDDQHLSGWEEDTEATLSTIERCTRGARSVTFRLDAIVDKSRPMLIAAMLDSGDYDFGGYLALRQELLYCLLSGDYANFAEIADSCPDLKAGLSELLDVSDEEWAELLTDERFAESVSKESGVFIERLVSIR